MKYSVLTSSGSGPRLTGNCWNSPGLIAPPVQSISVIASETVPSSVVMGLSSFPCLVVTVQPGTGCTDTDAIGWSVGRKSWIRVVEAVASSLGTRTSKAP